MCPLPGTLPRSPCKYVHPPSLGLIASPTRHRHGAAFSLLEAAMLFYAVCVRVRKLTLETRISPSVYAK